MSKKFLVPVYFFSFLMIAVLIFFANQKIANRKFQDFLNFGKAQISQFKSNETEIEELKKEISELKKEIEKIKIGKEEEIKSSLENIENKLKKLSGEVESLTEKTEQKEIEKEIERNWCQKNQDDKPKRDKIIFNEICWMGSENSPEDEWIELKNFSNEKINLTGWQILNEDKKIKIILDGEISAGGFFILERGNEDALPDVEADLIYNGALKNENEALFLFDQDCQLQDEVFANPNWPAGDNLTKRTMERKEDFSWQTSLNPGGTPKMENSKGYVEEKETLSEIIPKIEITEIMYNPEGNDEGREWIEIFNKGENSVDFSSLIFFENNTNHKLTLAQGKEKFPPKEYAIVSNNPENFKNDFPNYSKILLKSSFSLSNEGETIAIKYKESVLDEVGYNQFFGANGNGKSIQKIGAVWKEEVPSPGEENKESQVFLPSPQPSTPYQKVLISEIFFDAEGSDEGKEFIELYNPSNSEINLSEWSIQYLSPNATSIDKILKKNFEENNKIWAKNYFLIGLNGRGGDLTWSQALGNSGGTVFLVNNREKINSTNDENIIDRIGYGSGEGLVLPEKMAASLENFEPGKSLGRKWSDIFGNYIDNDNNQEDFEIQNPTPKAKNE